ncbi:uncharacterized protein LOC100678192 [Nasonia vitripennis]|uniref:Uncharacterized protein n=1 Tax=Nasonia vitripennis TaxID=7425 RepID=A0A7M7GD07_NASVI|nr:uncharacterized protein LOC100678192 [Nasonia vitripennis]
MSDESNVNFSKVDTKFTSTEDASAENHSSQDAELLQELGKLWLIRVGVIPLLPSSLLDNQKSDNDDKPNITIVFTDYREHMDMEKAIERYKEIFKSKTIAIQMNETCVGKPMIGVDNLPILSLQPSEKVQIRTSFCFIDEYENKNNFSAERMCEELIPEYEDSKIILLMFGTNDEGDNIAQEALKLAKKKLKPHTYNVWGSKCEEIIKEFNAADDQMPICFGLSICSSNIKAWTYINTDCYIKYTELHSSLLNFRRNVKLGSHSLALVAGPAELMNDANILRLEVKDHLLKSPDYMEIIKEVFPNVPLIGAFNYDCDNVYTSSPNSAGTCSDIFVCGKLISLLIISYD